jgi:hypothetical protein
VFSSGKVIGLIRMRGRGRLAAFPRFSEAVELLEFLAGNLVRIRQIERARERDRLLLLGEMSAGLAHEIRNPLGAIRGAVALMDPGSDPWAKVIREEVDRLNRLVSRFLDFATDSGERREPVDLNAVLQTGVAHLRPGLDSRVEIEWIPSPVPVPVILDPDSVQQVLSNLVQNSLKAFEEGGGGKIAIETFQTGFKVRDNGCGMSGEVLSRVFQPFFTTFKEGSGLKGIVATNSTTYSDGPPEFVDGTLSYQVASPHFLSDGVTAFKGTYNLIMRSDVARCLYKFSSAPVEAKIEVISDSGVNSVATTVVNERNGWINLSASNFEFSSPKIQVKLSQQAAPASAPANSAPAPAASAPIATSVPKVAIKTISCVKGKTIKKVSGAKPVCPVGYTKK